MRLVGFDAVAVAAVAGVAQPPSPAPQPGQGAEYGKASPIALVVVLLLGVALVLLIRSMNKHLRKVPESFDPEVQPAPHRDPSAGDAGPARDGAS